MSRLAQALQERDTGERVAVTTPLRYTRIQAQFENSRSFMPDESSRYEITATFGASVVVKKSGRHSISAHQAVVLAKQRIVHEVFGEYVQPLYEAMHALNDYDLDRARSLIQAVIRNFEQPTPFKEVA